MLKAAIEIISCKKESYSDKYDGLLGISFQKIMDALHFLRAEVVSFTRGLKDTPKIVDLS